MLLKTCRLTPLAFDLGKGRAGVFRCGLVVIEEGKSTFSYESLPQHFSPHCTRHADLSFLHV